VSEISDVRVDIDLLEVMIEALPGGADSEEIMVQACAAVLADRRATLAQLERGAAPQ
jgi:hypothetical protein